MPGETSKEKAELTQAPFNKVDIWKVASVIDWDCYEVKKRIGRTPFSSYELSRVGFRHKCTVTFIPGANILSLHAPEVGIFSAEYSNLQTVEIDEKQKAVKITNPDTKLLISEKQFQVWRGKFKLRLDLETENTEVKKNSLSLE